MTKARKEININIELSEVSNKCLRLISNTTQIVAFTSSAIRNAVTNTFSPIRTDGLPILFDNPENNKFDISPKEDSIDWLFKKAFEEFIVGLMESLIESYKILKYNKLSKSTSVNFYTESQIIGEIRTIDGRALSLPFPKLIEEIESELNHSLYLKEEIITINQVRNCLVHRNSIVTDKDINNKDDQSLRLSFIELVVLSEKDGVLIEVKYEDKREGFKTNRLDIQTRNKSISFKKGECVKIDSTTFNNISFTCYEFVSNLLKVMPEPD